MARFVHTSTIEASPARVFAFHQEPGALERLIPPWQNVRVVSRLGGLDTGALVELSVAFGPARFSFVARHVECLPGRRFVDVQQRGPFRRWEHRHEFAPARRGACRLIDRIDYSLPGGVVVDWLLGWLVNRQLRRMFTYRHAVTRAACERG